MSLFIHLLYNKTFKVDRNGARLPICTVLFSSTVMVRFTGNQSSTDCFIILYPLHCATKLKFKLKL